jgi:hypothetical protein
MCSPVLRSVLDALYPEGLAGGNPFNSNSLEQNRMLNGHNLQRYLTIPHRARST